MRAGNQLRTYLSRSHPTPHDGRAFRIAQPSASQPNAGVFIAHLSPQGDPGNVGCLASPAAPGAFRDRPRNRTGDPFRRARLSRRALRVRVPIPAAGPERAGGIAAAAPSSRFTESTFSYFESRVLAQPVEDSRIPDLGL